MTFAALVSAGFILGLAFNVYGVLGLSLVIVPVYFAGSLHLGVPQAAAWTFVAAAIFQFGCFLGFVAQDRLISRFAANSSPVQSPKRTWRTGGLSGPDPRTAFLAKLWSFVGPGSEFYAKATRLFGDANRPWNGPL